MKKTLPILALVGLCTAGCINNKTIPLCDGKNLSYNVIDTLAVANEGQSLYVIDGEFYMGDKREECVTDLGKNAIEPLFVKQSDGRKILEVRDKKGNMTYHIWEADGSFHKIHDIGR